MGGRIAPESSTDRRAGARWKGVRLEPGPSDISIAATAPISSNEFDDFWSWGRRYAQRLLNNESDSEDVVQDALCRLVARQQSGAAQPARAELAAIFARIIRNLCIDRLRRRKSHSNVDGSAWMGSEPTAESYAIARETGERLRVALERLPDRWREALLLRASQMNYEEISEALRCTKAQIRTWIFRARRQLGDELRLEKESV
jgi:RNA polymerase sigma-70 factor (ECF subfamily)